jgi:methanogenic corrinoid protein MtbC1
MKKLLLLTFVFTLFACSGGDDDNSVSINSDLVGAWETTITDGMSTAEQVFTLNADGTGSVSNLWDDGETFDSQLTWFSTSTTITFTTLENDETDSGEYQLSNNNNTFTITTSEGDVIIYTRI